MTVKVKTKKSKTNITAVVLSALSDFADFPGSLGLSRNITAAKMNNELFNFILGSGKIAKKQQYNVKRTINQLIKNKLILLSKDGKLELSDIGKKKMSDLEFGDFKIVKPEIWDKKYRVIIFDIPVEKNRIRHAIRRQLINWGFVRIQNSVWVNPYECQEVIGLLKNHFEVMKDIVYMSVERIENDGFIRKAFGLD